MVLYAYFVLDMLSEPLSEDKKALTLQAADGKKETIALDDIERRRLMDALTAAGGNKAKAARLLGYRRTTYCSKLKKFGIQ